jgi:hypothetical protein
VEPLTGAGVLVCRPVDEYAIAASSCATAEKLVDSSNKNVKQKSDYIKLHCKIYIDQTLQTHGLDKASRTKRAPTKGNEQTAASVSR